MICKSIIELPRTFPKATIAPVLIILSATFVAVPAFNLVDPVRISGPVARSIARSAFVFCDRSGLHVSKIVLALSDFARASAPRNKWRSPTRRDPDYDIAILYSPLIDCQRAVIFFVLGTFDTS